jgi:hypothetical protein
MQMRKLAATLLLLAGVSLFLGAQDEPNEISLSLEECIAKALKNNLSVQVELISPELAELSVAAAQEKFCFLFLSRC